MNQQCQIALRLTAARNQTTKEKLVTFFLQENGFLLDISYTLLWHPFTCFVINLIYYFLNILNAFFVAFCIWVFFKYFSKIYSV